MLDLPLLLRDGTILAVVASVWVMGSLRTNPRWFLRHYPEEVRAAAPPLTKNERVASRLVGLPFLAALVGIPIWSVASLVGLYPGATFLDAALHGFGVSMVFNLVDLLLLDLLWLGVLRPSWAMIPGTEAVVFRLNVSDHVRGFVVGTVLAVVIGCIAATVAGAWGKA